MTPDTALALVQRYSFLTRAIKACKKEISRNLEQCKGPKGTRLSDYVGSEQHDELHLKYWYTPDRGEEFEELVYLEVGEEQRAECPHCYAAHEVIQKRKAHRRALGAVKAAITKGGAA